VQAYPNSLLWKLVEDDTSDTAVLARSADEEGQCKSIVIDRDAELFEKVLMTSFLSEPVASLSKLSGAEMWGGLWTELDFYGLLPLDGSLPVATAKRRMLPAALLTYESQRIASKRAKLSETRVALKLKTNNHIVSLIVSQISELLAKRLLTDAQDISDAYLSHGASLDGTDWALPLEERLVLAPVPSSVNEESFCIVTGDDGQPRVVYAKAYSTAMGTRKALKSDEMRALLHSQLTRLGYTVSMNGTGTSFVLITVSWK
jgi:hypothetical protein